MDFLDDTPDGELLDTPVKPGTVRIILADSQAIYRVGIRKVFALEDDLRVVAQADSLENLRAAVERSPTDIVLLEGSLLAAGGGTAGVAYSQTIIASGGELSRIMLGLKGILADSDRISVLVFDEIDANVGGRLGSVIGRKLRGLAEHHQVLCITHLPQIASYADRHLTVRKVVGKNDTQTSVRMVAGEERIGELAEMIGGPRITDTTRAQARELLDGAQGEQPIAKPKRQSRNAKG